MNIEFQTAIKQLYPFFKETDTFLFKEPTLSLSNDFINAFPQLASLILKARPYEFYFLDEGVRKTYRLLIWTSKDDSISGWLCNLDTNNQNNLNFLDEHQLLTANIGGIQESFFDTDIDFELLSLNQNFLFVIPECYKVQDNLDDYRDQCKNENFDPIDTSNFICFVREANGNETFYDNVNGYVFLYATDHDFEKVIPIENQPEYSFYKIENADNFKDYVELLAKQWLEIVA